MIKNIINKEPLNGIVFMLINLFFLVLGMKIKLKQHFSPFFQRTKTSA